MTAKNDRWMFPPSLSSSDDDEECQDAKLIVQAGDTGSPKFRAAAVLIMKCHRNPNVPDRDGFFARYASGEDFGHDDLRKMGYSATMNHNLLAFMKGGPGRQNALGWEVCCAYR